MRGTTTGPPLLLLLTVTLGAAVGGVTLGTVPDDPTTAALSLTVSGDRLTFVHRGGSTLDVRRLRLRVSVGGEPLTRQPPVPFFAATGFHAGPTGPFNVAADPTWEAGEAASLRIAGTNDPSLRPGLVVDVTVFVDGRPLGRLSARTNEATATQRAAVIRAPAPAS